MFTAYPTYPKFRAVSLKLSDTAYEDVYAVQTALVAVGYTLTADGYFGPITDRAVRAYQSAHGLTVDGIAGGYTQKSLSVRIGQSTAFESGVPYARIKGQTEHESSDWLGIYSIQYPNGTWDAGVAQENTGLTPPSQGFNAPEAIKALAARVKHYYDHFVGLPTDRRWDLAQGAWNAPAFACYYAKKEGATQVSTSETRQPTADQAEAFNNYVAAVSVYA